MRLYKLEWVDKTGDLLTEEYQVKDGLFGIYTFVGNRFNLMKHKLPEGCMGVHIFEISDPRLMEEATGISDSPGD